MPRPPSPSIPEKTFLLAAIQSSQRLDGRSLTAFRTPEITFFDDVLGKVEVALGDTRVLASTSAKMVKPPPERPFEGIFTIHAEISPMAGWEDYEAGRPSEEEISLNRMLDKILRRSDVLDTESLCILANERVWQLVLTLHPLSDSGNLLDACILASLVSLQHFRRPEVSIEGEDVIVHPPTERAPVNLTLNHLPYCFTFVLYPRTPSDDEEDERPIAVLDPISLESRLCDGKITIVCNPQRELIVVTKSGGLPLSERHVLDLLEIAIERAKEMDKYVSTALREDAQIRVVEFR